MTTQRDDTQELALLFSSLEDLCPCRLSRSRSGGAQCYDPGDPASFCQCTVHRPISKLCTWPFHMKGRTLLRAVAAWGAAHSDQNKRGIAFVPNRFLKRLELLINEKGGSRYGT